MPLLICLCLCLILSPLSAQTFKDVTIQDPNYQAIEQAVKKGYLSFYQDQQFQPDKPLSRKEMAVILQKISAELDRFSQNTILSDPQDPNTLKLAIGKFDEKISSLNAQHIKLNEEFKTLHEDLSKTNDDLKIEVAKLKSDNAKQQRLLWLGIGGATILGILFK